jgi:plastocyanin
LPSTPRPLAEASSWSDTYQAYWEERLDSLGRLLACVASLKDPSPATRASEVRITRVLPALPPVVFAAWTDAGLMGRWMSPRGRAEVTLRPATVQAAEPTIDPALEGLPSAVPVDPDGTASEALVSIIDLSFQPDGIEVVVDDSVSWSNDDSEGHTVTAVDGGFNSGVVMVGDSFSTTFDTAGTYDYFCAIHPEMTGAVTVIDPRSAPARSGTPGAGPSAGPG